MCCAECALAEECPEYFDAEADPLRDIYRTPRGQEGERRDLCVYNSGRDIHESNQMVFEFGGRIPVSYSLSLVSPVRSRTFRFVCEDAVIVSDEADSTITVRDRHGSHTTKI